MIIPIFLVIFFIIYLISVLISEGIKNKSNLKNMLLGIEISIIGLVIVSISSPKSSDNMFLYIEWIGSFITILGLFILQRFFRKDNNN